MTDKKDCNTCKHFGRNINNTCFDCDGRYTNWEPIEKEIRFICGNCGKSFDIYHDGEGYNTGLCPDCLILYDIVGLPPKEKAGQKLIEEFIGKLEEYLAFEYDDNDPSFRCLDDLFKEDIAEYKRRLN